MHRRNYCLLSIGLFIISFIIVNYVRSSIFTSQRTQHNLPYRACIVSLIKGENQANFNKLLNMLHSLRLYFKNIDRYPIYLFHESNFFPQKQEEVRLCLPSLNIKFMEISFQKPFESNRSGYASMCQFWSYDIWFKYDFLRYNCDYAMRFDDDSYLTNSIDYDLFERFHIKQLDYVYRIIFHDINGLDFLRNSLQSFVPMNLTRRACIDGICTWLNSDYDGLAVYNNFFLVRVQLFYEYPIVESYVKQLVANHAFHHHRIGDANIQTICLMLIDKPLKITHWTFPYNHNAHVASASSQTYFFMHKTASLWYSYISMTNATCRKLLIAEKKRLATIQL
jgi:hypothetical protein